jgi:hypothetical protein
MKISSYFSLLGQYVVARRRVAGSGCYASPQQSPTMAPMMETALSEAWSAPAGVPVAHRDRPGNLRMLRRLNSTR